MLEHDVWSPGHLTVLATRIRRRREIGQRRHEVEVRRGGVRLAEGDEQGLLRATNGLVLAEALLAVEVGALAARPARLWSGDVDDGREHPPTAPAEHGPLVHLTVDVFGVRQGEVRATAAVERLTGQSFRADLLVDGAVAARLRTLGRRAEEAVVVAGDRELARLARFDHLRGLGRTVSSWDLAVAEIEDPRLRAVTLAAVLRLPALRAAANACRETRSTT